MRIPERLRDPAERARRLARLHAGRRQATDGASDGGLADRIAERRPVIILALLALIAVTGGLLALRSRETLAPPVRRPVATEIAARDLHALRVALERFRSDTKRYPSPREGLRALVRDRGIIGWRGSYVNLLRPDPWLRPYVYRVDEGRAGIASMGADGREGTADDIAPGEPTPDEVAGANGRWRLLDADLNPVEPSLTEAGGALPED